MLKKILIIVAVLISIVACGSEDKKDEDANAQAGVGGPAGAPAPTQMPAPINFRMMTSYFDATWAWSSHKETQSETTNVADGMAIYFDVPGKSCSEMVLIELSSTNVQQSEAKALFSLPMENSMNCQSQMIPVNWLGMSQNLRTKYLAVSFKEEGKQHFSPSNIKTYTWQISNGR